MTTATPFSASVLEKEDLNEHLVRLHLSRPEGFQSTGISDEWVGLVVPGQFQSRYYTLRSVADDLVIDVVAHEQGLVAQWVQTNCVGDTVGLGAPKGSYLPSAEAEWVVLAGDLTAFPAMARISEESNVSVHIHAEAPSQFAGYFPQNATWHLGEPSQLASVVEQLTWPSGPGYFWMGGESAQMRQIRRFLRRSAAWSSKDYDVMGYWSEDRGRQRRLADPGPAHGETSEVHRDG